MRKLLRLAFAFLVMRVFRRRLPEPETELLETGSSRPGDPIEPEGMRAAKARAKQRQHERIRRRRAEPPPTEERRIQHHPGTETIVIVALLGAAVAAAGFVVFYVAFPDTQLLGLALGVALGLLGLASALAGKRLVPQEKVVETYHYFGDREPQEDIAEIVSESAEGVSRRRLIAGAAGVAGASLGAAALVPAASLGPNVGDKIERTAWRAGRRVVGFSDEPVTAESIGEGSFETGFPEGASKSELGASIIIVRVAPAELDMPPERLRGAPQGIVAFSKICPHAGCAVSILREPKFRPAAPPRALVCPCHYSTFDPARGGHLLFGPAGRDLPQLPLRINARGELEAAGDFFDHPGPSYGGRRRDT